MPRDATEYLKQLAQERYRAIIIHTTPKKSQALTQFAKKVCEHLGGKYLDLLDLFIQTDGLKEHIDQFGQQELRKLLIEQSKDCRLLVVDKADFLLDTWRQEERKSLFRMIGTQWDGYKESTNAILILCLQSSQEVEAQKMLDSQEQSRVLSLSDFNDIL